MKKVVIALLIIIILVGAGIAVVYFYGQSKLDMIQYVNISEGEIKVAEVTEKTKQNLKKYRNIVLLGKDVDDSDYNEGRSDCIIIASINEEDKEVKLTSVYRDTYLEIEGHGLDKVNHAYAFGGPALTMSTLNTNLDLNITEFVTVNFPATKDIVNAVGGVTITVTDREANKIPGIYKAGTYNLNGEQALAYARIRKIDSDYKRTERMRNVLQAVFQKAKNMSGTELINLANMILPELSTNISKDEIMSLIPQITTYKVIESVGWPYKTEGIVMDNDWYGPPITLRSNVIELHKNVFGDEDYEPTEKVNEISQKIIDKTGYDESRL